jgi:hypothetical protein
MQHHLISQHGIAIWDASLKNFMLARSGHFHWIDFGPGMEMVQHLPPDQNRGGFSHGFARLLLGVHGVYFKSVVPLAQCYTYNGHCAYFTHPVFDTIAEECDWVRDIVELVRSQQASAFLQAGFYKQIGEGLPTRVSTPTAVIAGSALLWRLSELRAMLWSS